MHLKRIVAKFTFSFHTGGWGGWAGSGTVYLQSPQQQRVCEQRRAGEIKRSCWRYQLSWRKNKTDTEKKNSIQTFPTVPPDPVCCHRQDTVVLWSPLQSPTLLAHCCLHVYHIHLFLYSPPCLRYSPLC